MQAPSTEIHPDPRSPTISSLLMSRTTWGYETGQFSSEARRLDRRRSNEALHDKRGRPDWTGCPLWGFAKECLPRSEDVVRRGCEAQR